MTPIKEPAENGIRRLDHGVEQGLKRRWPLIHRWVRWHADRMTQFSSPLAWLVGLVVLIIFIVSLLPG